MNKTLISDSLAKAFPSHQYSTDPVELIPYEIDASFERGRPDGVFFPESTEDVARILRWANETKTPLISRGGGTGLAGGAVVEAGGFILASSRMNHIGTVDTVGRTLMAEVGAVNLDVDAVVKASGFYYPPDPSSQRTSTIGGNMGTNAGGPHCFKYGVTTNYVTGIRAVLADGQIIRFGGCALDYPEYDFCALLVGSEGTLAVMTEADLRLVPNPSGVKTMMVAFDSMEQAGDAVSAVIESGLVPATMEMMDQAAMKMITEFAPAGLPVDAAAALIVEVDGHLDGVDSQMEEVADLLDANGGFDLKIAQSDEDRAQIWYGRKSAAGALARLSPQFYLTDVTVPRSLLSDMLRDVTQICAKNELQMMNVFHAGDGNLHPLILCDESDPDLMARVHAAGQEIIQRCVDRDGSISGEHGIGIEKRPYMQTMFGANELYAMGQVRHVFDPEKLLNPGKIFPPELDEPIYEQAIKPESTVFMPNSAQEAASALRALSEAGSTVRITGEQSPSLEGTDIEGVILSTCTLDKVVRFSPADLYITVGAGMKVNDLQTFLAEHDMQSALLAPNINATVGGVLAANVNSPRRIRYDSLRDNLLCATIALADGRVMRAGRPLIKNVAGYDLPKIFVGSQGSLGVLIDVTLKLYPMSRAKKTVGLDIHSLQEAVALAYQILPKTLNCAGLTISSAKTDAGPIYKLVVSMEGMEEEIAAEMEMLQDSLTAANCGPSKPLAFSSAAREWGAFMGDVTDHSLIVRVGVPAAEMLTYLQMTDIAHNPELLQNRALLVDVASGFLYVKQETESVAQARALLDMLRRPFGLAEPTLEGYALIVREPKIAQAEQLDRLGYQPGSLDLMMELKQQWDPAGIL